MISVEAAVEETLKCAAPLGHEHLPLVETLGQVLADDVVSDVDMPPFNKSSMDGYALRASDVKTTPIRLHIVETIPAGSMPTLKIKAGQAAKIMTGAPLPEGSDSVQMVEKTELIDNLTVQILEPVPKGMHVAKQSEIMRKGDVILRKGQVISSPVIGLLASVGQAQVLVNKRPRVAILITGDELVDVERCPSGAQIRNSNGYTLMGQVASTGALPTAIGIASDDLQDLRPKLETGLEYDVLLVSGGVSMGDFDFVEALLSECGVRIIYDKINIKPGKPTVFGATDSCLVFGLPGNPVSASTIFEVIVRPALRKIMGRVRLENHRETAFLSEKFINRTQRTNYHPAVSAMQDGCLVTRPVISKGSADILAFAKSNSYLIATKPDFVYESGSKIKVMLRDEFWQT